MAVNKTDLSGVITETSKDSLKIKQAVGGVMDTVFRIHLPPGVRDAVSALNLSIGEEILVVNAQIYEKNGHFRLRIGSADQLIRLNGPAGETLYLGEEDAEQFL